MVWIKIINSRRTILHMVGGWAIMLMFLLACHVERVKAQVNISGKAKVKSKRITFINYRSDQRYIADIENNGSFNLSFSISKPGLVTLMCDKIFTPVFVQPGSTIEVTLDTLKKDDHVRFKGDFAKENNFMWKRNKNQLANYKEHRPDYDVPFDSFKVFLKDKYAKLKAKSHRYQQDVEGMNPAFVQYTTEVSPYSDLSSMLFYISNYAYQNKDDEQRFKHMLQYSIQPYLRNISLENENLLHNERYTRFLDMYLNYLTLKKFGKEMFDNSEESNEELLNQLTILKGGAFKNAKVKGYFAYKLAKQQLETYRKKNENLILSYYKKYCKNDTFRAKIEDLLAKTKSTTADQKINNYTFQSPKGKPVQLKDFKGNYVFIDLWATWCVPCRKEQKALEPIIEKYRNYNITFLSVSVDYKRDWDKWKKEVLQENVPGVQVLASESWQAPIMKDFSVKSIPHFILIGPNGKIINPDGPTPSGRLKNILSNLNYLTSKE